MDLSTGIDRLDLKQLLSSIYTIHIIEICRPPKKHARNEYARVQVPETPLTLSLCASENLMNHGYKKCVKQFLKN